MPKNGCVPAVCINPYCRYMRLDCDFLLSGLQKEILIGLDPSICFTLNY